MYMRNMTKINGGKIMKTRRLGKIGLMISEVGFGGEWLERHPEEESIELIRYASSKGINILDCWMADPKSRNIIGEGIKENRDQWFIQGHIGSTWKDEQYFRTRDMKYVRPAFEDLLKRLQTDYIDLGMIHYVDSEEEWEQIQHCDGIKKQWCDPSYWYELPQPEGCSQSSRIRLCRDDPFQHQSGV